MTGPEFLARIEKVVEGAPFDMGEFTRREALILLAAARVAVLVESKGHDDPIRLDFEDHDLSAFRAALAGEAPRG